MLVRHRFTYITWGIDLRMQVGIFDFASHSSCVDIDVRQCCWLNIPGKELGDAQTSSEYVAYNIQQLATSSVTGQVVVIGHSQGAGLTIQWALLYWPSTR